MAERPDTLAQAVTLSTRRAPERTALIVDGDRRSYAELAAGAELRARQLAALGIAGGERIGLLLPSSIDYVELLLGAAALGIVIVPINIRYKALELRHLITDSGMVALLTVAGIDDVVDFPALLCEALPEIGALPDWRSLRLSGAPALRTIARLDQPLAASREPPARRADGRDTLLVMYTSGTTAKPKGCVISNRALLANCWAITDRFGLGPDDLWWCPLPMFHIGGLLFPATLLAAGGTYAGMRHFEPGAAIDMLRRDPPTIFYPLFSTISLAMIEHPRFGEAGLGRLRLSCNVAPEAVQRRIQQAIPGAPLIGAFGMTEASGTVAYGEPAAPEHRRLATCGTPLAGWEVRIVDPADRSPLPPDARGEIAIRGEALFDGYLNDGPLAGSEHMADGFFLTGDVGSIDTDGALSFHGRFKDQLKVGGENVSALEVESFLATHPAIQLAQVVGVADEKYGEVPAAFIELKAGHSLTAQEALDFCAGRIARFKVPRHVRFVDQWPMSATKIVKYRLRQRIEAELAETPTLNSTKRMV